MEHRGQVQGVGPNGERLVQDAVAADLLELDIAQQVPRCLWGSIMLHLTLTSDD